MKKVLFLLAIGIVGLSSCDKVENIYPQLPSTELDYGLYPGTQQDYESTEWPTFVANTNTDRNILVEDFTGHKCIFCPPAAELAKTLEDNNPGRVYATAIHTGPESYDPNWGGVAPGAFQTIAPPLYTHNFANDEGLQIGGYFGADMPGSAFSGNPRGTISRIEDGSNQITLNPNNWTSALNTALAANDLKVNLQAESNFYPTLSGYFLHTEIEILDASLTNELNTVVYLVEDSIIKPQAFPSGVDSLLYVHRDIMRGCIDGRFKGQLLDANHLDANGKYYFNYSFALPAEYEPANMHVLIYVRDAVTEEIYQVIEQHIE